MTKNATMDLFAWSSRSTGPEPIQGAPALHETESAQREGEASTRAAKRPSIDQRFAEFHTANPHVAREMLRLAQARLARGDSFISAKALWEELRRSLDLADDGGAQGAYKLNNDFTALYSRMLIRMDGRLDGVLRLRRRKDER